MWNFAAVSTFVSTVLGEVGIQLKGTVDGNPTTQFWDVLGRYQIRKT